MTISPRAIEAAARACYEHEPQTHHTREILWDELGQGARDRFMHKARATLTAALAVDGLCLVPKEPTEAMIEAGDDLVPVARGTETYTMARGRKGYPEDIYRAMIAAASTGDSTRQDNKK